MRAGVCDLVDEPQERAIALVDADDGAAGEEAIAQVADGALDLALVLGRAHRAQPRLDAHLRAQLEQRRVEAHGVAARSSTTILGLSNSHWRVTPPKARAARTSERHSEWTVRSKTNSPHSARECESTITNSHSARSPPGTASLPT